MKSPGDYNFVNYLINKYSKHASLSPQRWDLPLKLLLFTERKKFEKLQEYLHFDRSKNREEAKDQEQISGSVITPLETALIFLLEASQFSSTHLMLNSVIIKPNP